MEPQVRVFVAFAGNERIRRGALIDAVTAAKERLEQGRDERIALFDEETGGALDVDLSGTDEEVLAKLRDHPVVGEFLAPTSPPPRGPGRPKLGVVSREVSLLPRHWSWLGEQRSGASATLRRLIDAARRESVAEHAVRRAVDAAHRFLWDMAGDQPNFEEVTRELFAHNFETLEQHVEAWPADLREQLNRFIDKAKVALAEA